MRKSHLLAALVAGVAVAATVLSMTPSGSDAAAQAPARAAMRPAPARPAVALLDVSYIFKKHARFKAMMAALKANGARAESRFKVERDAIRKLQGRLDPSSPTAFRQGSAQYKELEEELATRSADLTVKIQLWRKEFLQNQAKIYHNVYQEVLQEVDYYSLDNRITMVLRFNGDPVNAEKPEDVLRHINNPVTWYAKNLDITPIILERLNRTNPNPGANRVGTPPSRPGVGVRY